MSPENDRDSQYFKLPYFATCLHRVGSLKKPYFRNDHDSQYFKLPYFASCLCRVGSLKKPYFRTEWVGVARSGVIGSQRVGLLLMWNSFSLVIPAEHNNLANTAPKCLWCSRSQSLSFVGCVSHTAASE